MTVLQTFAPAYGSGVSVTATGTSAASVVGGESKSLCITNTGTNIGYVRVGTSTATASAADYPIVAGAQVTITKPQDSTHCAYFSSAGTTFHIMGGEGF
jgi:hypothetical protein